MSQALNCWGVQGEPPEPSATKGVAVLLTRGLETEVCTEQRDQFRQPWRPFPALILLLTVSPESQFHRILIHGILEII